MAIYSFTPKNHTLGTLDNSIRTSPPPLLNTAQFKPKFYIYAEKGPLEPQEVDGGTLLHMYGEQTIDQTSKYFNHATLMLKDILGSSTNCIVERVFDPAQVVKANATIWLDIALDDLPVYERNFDGTYILNGDGDPIQKIDGDGNLMTEEGYKYRVYSSYVDNNSYDTTIDLRDIYTPAIQEGFMNDKNGDLSLMYPIITNVASSHGETYNNEGFSIYPMSGEDADENLMSDSKIFPYYFSRHSTASGIKQSVPTKYGDEGLKFVFGEAVEDSLTNRPLQLETMVPHYYENPDDPEMHLQFSDFDTPHVYYSNIKAISEQIFAREAVKITTVEQEWDDGMYSSSAEWFDFEANDTTALSGQSMLMNLLSGVSSKGVNYFTFAKATDSITLLGGIAEVNISSSTTIFLNGGADGQEHTLDNFEFLVTAKLHEFLDRNSHVIPSSINPESIFVDSGFSVDTKIKLCNVIAVRRDVSVALSTHVWNENNSTVDIVDHIAIASSLKNKLKLMPESTYFGTTVARAIIVMGSGIKTDGTYRYRVPQLLDFMVKAGLQMGAGNGKFKSGFNFGRSPKNVVTSLRDLEPRFIPESVKSTLWKSGLIWTQNKDKRTWFYPSQQTVYENDTSILNAFTSIVAITTIVKIHEDCWEEFSGSNDLTNAGIVEGVEAYMNTRLAGIFDGIVETDPKCIVTEDHQERGYNWKLVTFLYGNNMKTVSESHIVAMRAEDRSLTN